MPPFRARPSAAWRRLVILVGLRGHLSRRGKRRRQHRGQRSPSRRRATSLTRSAFASFQADQNSSFDAEIAPAGR